MVLFGLDLRYLMAGCLAVSHVTDIVTLKGYSVLTAVPLIGGILYHALHGTLNEAAIALAIPFIFNLIRFVTRRLALYDILVLGMVGVIMGWPFGLLTTIASKGLQTLIKDTWVVKLLGRNRGEDVYAFPYMALIVPVVVISYYLFNEFPETETGIRKLIEPLIRWIISLV